MKSKNISPFEFSIVDLIDHLKASNISAESIIEAVYERIDQYNSSLNVFLSLLPRDIAINRARKIDKKLASGKEVGKLAGIPFSIKDNICISDSDLTFEDVSSSIIQQPQSWPFVTFSITITPTLSFLSCIIISVFAIVTIS